MKRRTFLQSLNNAADGFIHVLKEERNMRVHFLVGFLVLLFAVYLGVSRVEWIILCMVISFVLMAEMFNTAIEDTVDLVSKAYHPAARIIKDISAGVVLVSVVNALVVGYFVFSRYLDWPLENAAARIRHESWTITFVALIAVIFFVVLAKVLLHRGTPFRGGIASGHSAIAFGLWTAVFLSNRDFFIVGITFLLAALVAQSRLRAKIHSFFEVLAGSLIGILVVTLFFQIFRA